MLGQTSDTSPTGLGCPAVPNPSVSIYAPGQDRTGQVRIGQDMARQDMSLGGLSGSAADAESAEHHLRTANITACQLYSSGHGQRITAEDV